MTFRKAFIQELEKEAFWKELFGLVKRNKATDVLSFSLKESFSPDQRERYLGEIVICPDIVRENAEMNRTPEKEELFRVFIHGILHLCGYEHEKSKIKAEKMEKKEKFYLNKIYAKR